MLLAGNVMIFLEPGPRNGWWPIWLVCWSGGLLVAGFSLRPGRLSVDRYDELTASAGMTFWQRFSTWDREPFDGGDYAVSAHRRTAQGKPVSGGGPQLPPQAPGPPGVQQRPGRIPAGSVGLVVAFAGNGRKRWEQPDWPTPR